MHLASTSVWALQEEKWKVCFGRELDRKEDLIKDLKHTPLEQINNHQGIKTGRTVLKIVCKVTILGNGEGIPSTFFWTSKLVKSTYCISFQLILTHYQRLTAMKKFMVSLGNHDMQTIDIHTHTKCNNNVCIKMQALNMTAFLIHRRRKNSIHGLTALEFVNALLPAHVYFP